MLWWQCSCQPCQWVAWPFLRSTVQCRVKVSAISSWNITHMWPHLAEVRAWVQEATWANPHSPERADLPCSHLWHGCTVLSSIYRHFGKHPQTVCPNLRPQHLEIPGLFYMCSTLIKSASVVQSVPGPAGFPSPADKLLLLPLPCKSTLTGPPWWAS